MKFLEERGHLSNKFPSLLTHVHLHGVVQLQQVAQVLFIKYLYFIRTNDRVMFYIVYISISYVAHPFICHQLFC